MIYKIKTRFSLDTLDPSFRMGRYKKDENGKIHCELRECDVNDVFEYWWTVEDPEAEPGDADIAESSVQNMEDWHQEDSYENALKYAAAETSQKIQETIKYLQELETKMMDDVLKEIFAHARKEDIK